MSKHYRYIEAADLRAARESIEDSPRISGYFAVFDDSYQIADGVSESVSPSAFDDCLGDDVRCLFNHDSAVVLGRTSNDTLKLKVDERGLWGEVLINPHDSQAMDIYQRIARGDISQCSFGFEILHESQEVNGGDVHFVLEKVRLLEVSPVTFPAYQSTEIKARKSDRDEVLAEKREAINTAWKGQLYERIKKVAGQARG